MAAAFILIFAIQGEAFPSLFVTISFGISSMVGHFVSVGAGVLAEVPPPIPMIIFTALSSIAFVAHFFLSVPGDKEKLLQDIIMTKVNRMGNQPEKASLLEYQQ